MLRAAQKYFSQVSAVVIDGALYVLIAVFGSIVGLMTSDEVYKYMNAYVVFYLKAGSSVMLAGTTALKMFRSTSYSDHQAAKKLSTGNTETFTK